MSDDATAGELETAPLDPPGAATVSPARRIARALGIADPREPDVEPHATEFERRAERVEPAEADGRAV